MYISLEECNRLAKRQFKNIIHIGASWGQEIESYHKNGVESVVWFEASQRFMAKLFDNTARFKIQQNYLNYCLSDVTGETVKFNITNNGESSSMLEFGSHSTLHPQVSIVGSEELTTFRFDEIYKQKRIDINKVDFINVDVQGAELKVLKGFGDLLSLPNIKAVYSEVNFEHVYKDCCLVDELDEYLGKFGFIRVKTLGEMAQWKDALYLKKE